MDDFIWDQIKITEDFTNNFGLTSPNVQAQIGLIRVR